MRRAISAKLVNPAFSIAAHASGCCSARDFIASSSRVVVERRGICAPSLSQAGFLRLVRIVASIARLVFPAPYRLLTIANVNQIHIVVN